MFGSVFREWKVAATFVGGIAALTAAYFAEGGGYEQLQVSQAKPVAAISAPAPSGAPIRPTSIGFTSDAELEAAFAEPSEPAATPSAEPEAAEAADAPTEAASGVAAEPGAAPAAGPSAPAEQHP